MRFDNVMTTLWCAVASQQTLSARLFLKKRKEETRSRCKKQARYAVRTMGVNTDETLFVHPDDLEVLLDATEP